MAINQLPVPTTGDNWVQVATSTPTSGTAVTFSSIATVYSKLMVMITANAGATFSGANTGILMTINGVTSGYCAPTIRILSGGTLNATTSSTSLNLIGASDPAGFIAAGFFTVESANSLTVKRITGGYTTSNGTPFSCFCDNGFFAGSAAVTSITATLGGGVSYQSGLTFTLYGVRA